MPEAKTVEVPKLYENMDEATIGAWRVSVGQDVKVGDALVELITDKTVADIEAPCDGVVLAVFATEKSTVPLGYALCAIGENGSVVPDVNSHNEALLKAHIERNALNIDLGVMPAAAVAKKSYRVAPAARMYAKQQGIDLDKVAEFCGRDTVHRKDVDDYIAAQANSKPEVKPEQESIPETKPVEVENSVNKVAIVTGASGAIGGAIAKKLAGMGMNLALHCNSNAGKARALAEELSGNGIECAVFIADLTCASECKKLVADVIAKWGHVDVLVNNAGILDDSTVSFMSDEKWLHSLNVNLTAPFYLIREVSMIMARRRWGRIVNMASDAGRMGSANRSNYAAAKEGLVGLTRSVAQELAGLGVRVNAVSPGFVESPMTAGLSDEKRKQLIRDIPVRRLGRPADVAALVGFLCSDEADYITGQVISVDGGLFMG